MNSTTLKVSAIAATALALVTGAALFSRSEPLVPTNAPKAEFCDYWKNFPQHEDDVDPMSEEALEQDAADFRALGVPTDASDQVRESLEMRVEFVESWARGELTENSDPTQGDQDTWLALEDYVKREC